MISKRMRSHDELLVAKILTSAEAARYKLRPGEVFGITGHTGQCCALGAGILFAGIDSEEFMLNNMDAVGVFAKKYKVSRSFAHGVTNGFETRADGSFKPWDVFSPTHEIGSPSHHSLRPS